MLIPAGVAWPELLSALFEASQSQDPAQRENAFRIFSTTPQIIEKQHEEVVMSAFKTGFSDSETAVCSHVWTQNVLLTVLRSVLQL
jgi:importin-5